MIDCFAGLSLLKCPRCDCVPPYPYLARIMGARLLFVCAFQGSFLQANGRHEANGDGEPGSRKQIL